MVAGGIDSTIAEPVGAMADLALSMKRRLEQLNREYNTSFRIRIGISRGPVTAGVIGRHRFAYDIWGNTVNTACYLESRCPADGIFAGETVYMPLKDRYIFGGKLEVQLKTGSKINVYNLCGRRGVPVMT